MTIIRQKKNQSIARPTFIALIALSVCAALVGIVYYNRVVNGNHEIARHKDELRALEVKNAELKAALYALTDAKSVEAFAAKNGLVIDRNPNYARRSELSVTMR